MTAFRHMVISLAVGVHTYCVSCIYMCASGKTSFGALLHPQCMSDSNTMESRVYPNDSPNLEDVHMELTPFRTIPRT